MEQYQVWMADSMGLRQGTNAPMLLLLAVDAPPAGQLTVLPPEGVPCRVVGAMSPGIPMAAPAPAAPRSDDGERRITRLLTAIGVPSNLLGFAYLRAALVLAMGQPDMCKSLTTRLYPSVAEQFSVAPRSVERAIRHAIGQTWLRSGGEGYRQVLGRLGSIVGERPTNSEFLSQTAECIRVGAFL